MTEKRWVKQAAAVLFLMILSLALVPQVWITGIKAQIDTLGGSPVRIIAALPFGGYEGTQTADGLWRMEGFAVTKLDSTGIIAERPDPETAVEDTLRIRSLQLCTNYGKWDFLLTDGRCTLHRDWEDPYWTDAPEECTRRIAPAREILVFSETAVRDIAGRMRRFRLGLSFLLFAAMTAVYALFCTGKIRVRAQLLQKAAVWVPALTALWMILCYLIPHMKNAFLGDLGEITKVAQTWFLPENQRYESYVEYRGSFIFIVWAVLLKIAQFLHMTPEVFFRILMAGCFVLAAAVMLPALFERIFSRRFLCREKVLFILVLYYVMRGYFEAPWTDPVALMFCLAGLSLTFRIAENIADGGRNTALALLGAGQVLTVLFAAGFRSTYKINVVFFFLAVFLFVWMNNRKKWPKALFFCLAAAAAEILLMQLLLTSEDQSTLFWKQVGNSFLYQKVDFNESLWYANPIGMEMLEKLGLDMVQMVEENAMLAVITVLIHAPLKVFASAVKGVFNGMDWTYDSIALFGANVSGLRIFVYYSVVFAGICAGKKLLARASFRKDYWAWVYAVILAANALPYALSIVESRFFITIVILFLGLGVFGLQPAWEARSAQRLQGRRPPSVLPGLAGYILFLALCWMLHLDTCACLMSENPILNWI